MGWEKLYCFLEKIFTRLWNKENYDVNKIPYTKQAYEKKKYAFVSDYARFDILYQYGGIYFDTDVEVIMLMDNLFWMFCVNKY